MVVSHSNTSLWVGVAKLVPSWESPWGHHVLPTRRLTFPDQAPTSDTDLVHFWGGSRQDRNHSPDTGFGPVAGEHAGQVAYVELVGDDAVHGGSKGGGHQFAPGQTAGGTGGTGVASFIVVGGKRMVDVNC